MASEYLEDSLSPKLVWEFSYHAERCKGCNTFLSTLRATLGMLKSLPSREAPEELKQRLRKQYFSGSTGSETDTHHSS